MPGFVQQVAEKCGLVVGSQAASATPAVYADGEDAEALIEHLTDPGRLLPTIVLTLADGASAPYIKAEKLAGVLTGLAHVALARPDAAWRLTERLGKRLSVFGGAARVYQPGFEETAELRPYPAGASSQRVGHLGCLHCRSGQPDPLVQLALIHLEFEALQPIISRPCSP